MRQPLFRFLPFAIAVASLLVQPGEAVAQLRVLSKGNATAEWRKAQLAALDAQLADKSTNGELKQELTAQQKWLTNYSGDKLAPQPVASAASSRSDAQKPLEEPTLDPDNRATELRKRLLGPKAKPTATDTEKLRKALEEKPDDLGLRQLQLHWLDQPQYREEYPTEIAEAAGRLVGLIETSKKIPADEKKAVVAWTLYRQARALGYRMEPEVVAKKPLDEEQRKKIDEQLVGVYNQLMNLVGSGRPEFALLEIRMLRRDGWFGRALEVLESNGGSIDARWYLEKRRDLLRELKWSTPAEQAHQMFAESFPEEARSFPNGFSCDEQLTETHASDRLRQIASPWRSSPALLGYLMGSRDFYDLNFPSNNAKNDRSSADSERF